MRIKSLDDIVKYTNASMFIKANFIESGKNFISKDVELNEDEILTYRDGSKSYDFKVYSSEYNMYYNTSIWLNGLTIKRVSCDCSNYYRYHSCEHIVAILNNEYDLLFNERNMSDIEVFSKKMLKTFNDVKQRKHLVKKEVFLELDIDLKKEYRYYSGYESTVVPRLLIGEKKKYVLSTNINNFEKIYNNKRGTLKFGKEFTYDPDLHYLSPESEELLSAYIKLSNGRPNRFFYKEELKKFFNDIKDMDFIIGGYQIYGIKDDFPIETKLTKKDNIYELQFDIEDVIKILDDYEYILYKGKMYHLKEEQSELLSSLINGSYDHLEFSDTDIESFTNGLLHDIKNNIVMDSNIDNIVLPSNTKTEIYFDLGVDKIIANIKFIYDDIKVDYFDKSSNVLRDNSFENKVINELLKYGFTVEKEQLLLDDIVKEVEFLENGLEELSSYYPVFTTEKFKNVNITKKTNIASSFSIGKDNILNFSFDLNGINPNELLNIFKDIKNKKKYFRLKSGDIISLENQDLIELAYLSDDLELSDEEIIEGRGSVLKYRALYLDSLKNKKYNIIKTDSLFDEFINNFYKYKDSELTLKDLSKLREYQVTGVKWLYNLDKCGFGGILADEMGLGKTIQIIYYIRQMLLENKDYKFLIVVPTSLAYNWEHEFNMFGSDINKLICLGTKDKRIKILKELKNNNVVITTYGLLREDEELYKELKFHTMIIDEAQNIKNNHAGVTKSCKSINADTKFALTGTPLENSVLELWSIFDFIMPGYLSSLNKFSSKYKIKEYNDYTNSLIEGLSHQINPFMLRRKKEDVLADLPEKMENDIYIDLSDKQKELYALEATKVKKEMDTILKTDGINKARFMILELLTKLRQICIDPSIIYEDYNETSNKIETLTNIIDEYILNNHKMLLFSSFRTGLSVVKKELDKKKIKYYQIDGSTPASKRQEMVDDFNKNDEIKVFLIMLKAGGTGLNLIGADTVIHLDLWWNPQAENQATDRAHRIGQTKNVEVIHLITKGTIEEKIKELQEKKKILSDKLIDGEIRDENVLSKLSSEDIKELLSYENKE